MNRTCCMKKASSSTRFLVPWSMLMLLLPAHGLMRLRDGWQLQQSIHLQGAESSRLLRAAPHSELQLATPSQAFRRSGAFSLARFGS